MLHNLNQTSPTRTSAHHIRMSHCLHLPAALARPFPSKAVQGDQTGVDIRGGQMFSLLLCMFTEIVTPQQGLQL